MEFTEIINVLLLGSDLNQLLEKESKHHYNLVNNYYSCYEHVVAEEKGIQMGESLRWLLQNLGIDPLNIELNEEEGYALLYHKSSKIFKVKIEIGINNKPFSIYKDYYFNFNTVTEIYSDY